MNLNATMPTKTFTKPMLILLLPSNAFSSKQLIQFELNFANIERCNFRGIIRLNK